MEVPKVVISNKQESHWRKRYLYPTIDGSFIQNWLVKDWSLERWINELNILKEACMNYLILAPTVSSEKDKRQPEAIYPSQLPNVSLLAGHEKTLDNCFEACKTVGLKVFLGLNEDNHWWKLSPDDASWFLSQMHFGNEIAQELYTTYKDKYPETFYGWYWVWEISSMHLEFPQYQQFLSEALNLQIDYLDTLDPSMPLMFCPYMVEKISSKTKAFEAWSNFFKYSHLRAGDIFCPQDSVGAGNLRLEDFSEWFNAIKKASLQIEGLIFWSDVENFTQEDWTSSTLDRFISQLQLPSTLVDNYISFAYCHYYSPNIVPSGFHQGYLEYLKNGKLQKEVVPSPDNLKWEVQDNRILLSWNEQDLDSVCGYLIFKNGVCKARLQPKPNTELNFILQNNYFDNERSTNDSIYEVVAYDYNGNRSVPSLVKIKLE